MTVNKNNIKYIDNFLFDNEKDNILEWLKSKNFKKGVNNDNSVIKRKQLWFQKEQKPFNKKWERFDRWCSEKIYDSNLLCMEFIIYMYLKKHNLIENVNININSCLINKYENGSEFIKFHQDSKLAFGENHFILLYSLGEERTMTFKHINDSNNTFEIKLKSNSLLIIYPEINKVYQHSILKDDTENPRFSMTFREFIS
jgi:hypothetical protein